MHRFCLVTVAVGVFCVASACPPPTLPPGGRWVSGACGSNNGTYNTATERCRCWGHCGYICTPTGATTASATGTTSGTSVTGTTSANQSPCPFGGVWYNPKGQRCHCQSYNKQSYYVCEGSTTTSITGSTTTGTTTASTGTTTASTGTTTASTGTTTASGGTTAATTATTTASSGTTAATTATTTVANG